MINWGNVGQLFKTFKPKNSTTSVREYAKNKAIRVKAYRIARSRPTEYQNE